MTLTPEDIVEIKADANRDGTEATFDHEAIVDLCDLAAIGHAVLRRNGQCHAARDISGGTWSVGSMVRLARDAVDALWLQRDQEAERRDLQLPGNGDSQAAVPQAGRRWEPIAGNVSEPVVRQPARRGKSTVITIDLPGGFIALVVAANQVQWERRGLGLPDAGSTFEIDEEPDQ